MKAVIAMCMLAAASVASAQTFPNGAVRLLIGYPPGGSADFTARVVAGTEANLHAAVTAAIAALSGPAHGGAAENVMAMAMDIGEPERVLCSAPSAEANQCLQPVALDDSAHLVPAVDPGPVDEIVGEAARDQDGMIGLGVSVERNVGAAVDADELAVRFALPVAISGGERDARNDLAPLEIAVPHHVGRRRSLGRTARAEQQDGQRRGQQDGPHDRASPCFDPISKPANATVTPKNGLTPCVI